MITIENAQEQAAPVESSAQSAAPQAAKNDVMSRQSEISIERAEPVRTEPDYEQQAEDVSSSRYAEETPSRQEEQSSYYSDPDIKAFAEWKQKYPEADPRDFFEAIAIDPDSWDVEELMWNKVASENPHLDEDGVRDFLALEYGIGADMEELRTSEDPTDRKLYYTLLKRQNDAIAEQKQILQERKVTLSSPRTQEQTSQEQEQQNLEAVARFQEHFNNSFKDVREFEFSGIRHNVDRDKLADAIGSVIMETKLGDDNGVMLMGVSAKDVVKALYFLKNERAIASEIAVSKEKEADEIYNNVKSPQEVRRTTTSPQVTVRRF